MVLSQSHTSNNKSHVLTIIKLYRLNISLFYYFLKKNISSNISLSVLKVFLQVYIKLKT